VLKRPRKKKLDPIRLFHKIKIIAFEAGITIVFLFWVVKEVRHQLEWDRPVPPVTTEERIRPTTPPKRP
jgi:hypothetical protein